MTIQVGREAIDIRGAQFVGRMPTVRCVVRGWRVLVMVKFRGWMVRALLVVGMVAGLCPLAWAVDEPIDVPTLTIDMPGTVTSLIDTLAPGIKAVLGFGLALWAIYFIVRSLRRTAKG